MGEWLLLWRWWLVLELLGFIVFPLVASVARNLEDKGYCLAKPLGILLLSYFVWIISSAKFMKFGYTSILFSLFLIGILTFFLNRKFLSLKELPLKKMVVVDLVFLAAFIIFAWILRYKPDLYFGYSEDFMDFAFTNSILRTDYFPPQDPWMSQNNVSYYYGGFLIAANLIKISRIPASFGPNFIVATFFGLAAASAYGLAANVARSKVAGTLAGFLVCVTGYLSGAFQFVAALTKHDFMGYKPLLTPGWKDWLLSFNFWDAGRIIPGTLNYYPYYSFLQSDMHPPTLSIPFQVSFLFLVGIFAKKEIFPKIPIGETALLGFLMALNLGFLFFIHSWDYPVYVMVLVLAAVFFKRFKAGLVFAGAVTAGSFLLFLPYILRGVGGGFQGIGLVSERTELSSALEMLGPFLFIIFSMLIIMSTKAGLKGYQIAIFSSLAIIAIPVFKFPLLVLLLPAIVLPVYILLVTNRGNRPLSARGGSRSQELMLFFVLAGALVIFFTEVFYLKDALRGPLARFNTVLKLYYSIWIFWGLAAAMGFRYVFQKLSTLPRYLWLFPAVVFLAASMVHPVAATTGWTSGRHTVFGINRGTWDGTVYLKSLYPADYEATAWIDQNIKGMPVMLEAPGGPYSYSSRVASLTGLPTVIGWGMHEIMWRGDWGGVERRTNDADNIYNSQNESQVVELLRKYNVRYVYVGSLETQKYSPGGLAKFRLRPDLFRLIYSNSGSQIYEVIYGT